MSNDEEPIEIVATGDDSGRLDQVLARRYPGASRRLLSRFIADGNVRVDGRRAKKGQRIEAGNTITLVGPPPTAADLAPRPEPAPLTVLYIDDDLLAVDKPSGIACHPLREGELGTIANRLIALHPECASASTDVREAGLAHRLDRDTSGVLLVARNRQAWTALRDTFSEGRVEKTYLGLATGSLDDGDSELPIAQRGKRVAATDADFAALPAHTEWAVVERFDGFVLVRCRARTGRMHQIRAHLAAAGAPLAGDSLYGGPDVEGLSGHFLHAERLTLAHPVSGQSFTVEAALPAELDELLARLRSS
jgi:23S rRNA pseudouridine1911/1915/1917 synthase